MRKRVLPVLGAVTVLAGCGDGPSEPDDGALFTLEVSGEVFRALVFDEQTIQALEERRASGHEGVVSGALVAGDGGFNGPWGWHWDPESVHVADFSAEVCDGRPSMVDEDLTYWIETVRQFCPWGATVTGRER